jgi:hypothetical protein
MTAVGVEPELLSQARDVAPIASAIIAALAISGSAREVWRRTLGRRRDMARRLRRLGVGAQVSFFEAALGDPAAMRHAMPLVDDPWIEWRDPPRKRKAVRSWLRRLLPIPPKDEQDVGWIDQPILIPELDQLLWVFPDCYVQAFVDQQGSVEGFTVTQRTRQFRPSLSFPPGSRTPRWWRPGSQKPFLHIRLGITRLADVGPSETPAAVRAVLTVRPWFYADLHSFGNPGYYLCFVAGTSYCGNPREVGELMR